MLSFILNGLGILFILHAANLSVMAPTVVLEQGPALVIMFYLLAVYGFMGLGFFFLLKARAHQKKPRDREVYGFSFQLGFILTGFVTFLGIVDLVIVTGTIGRIILVLFLLVLGGVLYHTRVLQGWVSNITPKKLDLRHPGAFFADLAMVFIRLLIETVITVLDLAAGGASGGGGSFSGGGASGSW